MSSGFISASAIVILTSQMKDILGIQASGDSFVAIWKEVIENIEDTKTWDAVMGFICLIVLLIMRVSHLLWFTLGIKLVFRVSVN